MEELPSDIILTIISFNDFMTICTFRATCQNNLKLIEAKLPINIHYSDMNRLVQLWYMKAYLIDNRLIDNPSRRYFMAHKFSIASLNDFRKFYELKFDDINEVIFCDECSCPLYLIFYTVNYDDESRNYCGSCYNMNQID